MELLILNLLHSVKETLVLCYKYKLVKAYYSATYQELYYNSNHNNPGTIALQFCLLFGIHESLSKYQYKCYS